MFNESRSPAYNKEMSSRLLTDATIMGSTPRLNLEKVYDDPFLIKAKENQIIALSDQITQINRENATEAYHLTLKHQLIKLRNKKLRKRDAQLKKRDAASKSYEMELAEALEQKKKAEEKMKISKINFEKAKGLYDEMLNEFGEFVKSEDDKTSDANQLELLEAFTPDFSKEGEEQADMEERIYLVSQIKEKERDVAKLKHAYRHAQFQEYVYDGEFAKIHCERDKLMIQAQNLQQRLDRLNKRYDIASKKKSKPYDPVHYEDGLIEQTEKTADEAEKRLTRSRVDAIEYDLQHEYSSYQALKNENKQRKYELQIRHNDLLKAKEKQKKRSKIIQQMTPRSKEFSTEINISMNSSSGLKTPQTRNAYYQMKQDEIDRLNNETEELDKQNKESRAGVEKDYYDTMQKVLSLNAQLLDSEENYIQLCNCQSEVDKARLQENDLSLKIKKLEVEKQELFEKVKNLPKYKPPPGKTERITKSQEEANAKEDKLKAWRDRVSKKKAEVDELQRLVDEAMSRYDELNKHINQIITSMNSNIGEIEYLSNNMSIIRLTAQKEHIKEEEEEEEEVNQKQMIVEEEEEVNQNQEIIEEEEEEIQTRRIVKEEEEEEEVRSLFNSDDHRQLEIHQEEEEVRSLFNSDDHKQLEIHHQEEEEKPNLEEVSKDELAILMNNDEENHNSQVDEAENQQYDKLDQQFEIDNLVMQANEEEEQQIILQANNEEEDQILIRANNEEEEQMLIRANNEEEEQIIIQTNEEEDDITMQANEGEGEIYNVEEEKINIQQTEEEEDSNIHIELENHQEEEQQIFQQDETDSQHEQEEQVIQQTEEEEINLIQQAENETEYQEEEEKIIIQHTEEEDINQQTNQEEEQDIHQAEEEINQNADDNNNNQSEEAVEIDGDHQSDN